MKRKLRRSDPKKIIIIVLSVLLAIETILLVRPILKRFFAVPPAQKVQPKKIEPKEPTKGSIAIIIDDWGYNAHHCQYLEAIDAPVTISVLPNLAHSTDIAECAHRNNKEVILHLPLEPHKSYEVYPTDYVIKISMSEKKIEELLNKTLRSVPYAAGINNHMGSKATEDETFMRIIFSRMKKNGLFFVDSLVTDRTICRKLAYQMRVPFTARDIFLDNESNQEYIENQFAKLMRLAQRRGYAIGTAHDRTLSLKVIKDQIKNLREQGFDLVTIQELITQHEYTRH